MWEDKLIELGKFTENFLQPFQQLALLEQTVDVEQSYTSPWIEKGLKTNWMHWGKGWLTH